ncbi:O-antigen polysaccharide polymerase Wzy family protein [Amphibacillus sp. MSJ-3]|uniref:O-antigen polysaccharide polymerase Wzy n=1 Tax=Amphibacillus sp. MSJ-3 TaxID=2841505 RepID=UPI001C0E9444|nr:O-antigen polysaccharide polymerase Wzy [Amphibacillus sp. MSJ-3]MBU5594397.1 O-antigen polysaccharide polymerase Wzy family protein [Amphibacillus sp. MSJ-3]
MRYRIVNKEKIYILLITVSSLAIFYLLYPNIEGQFHETSSKLVFILSWIGIFELCYIIVTWRSITKKYITLYTMFMSFFFLFNFGQCFLWAFGIHIEGEIGSTNLYYNLAIPDNSDIIKTQLLVLISGIMIHFGATIFKKSNNDLNKKGSISLEQNRLFNFAKIIAPVVIFAEFYSLFIDYRNAQIYGYTALYYNPEVVGAHVIFKIISRLFIPILVSLLLGSNYKKKVVRFVYVIFGINIFLNILIGNRGSWLYGLCILIICHHHYYKKIRLKQFTLISIMAIFISYISSALVALRNSGVTVEKLVNSITTVETNPIINAFFSIGQSMGVTTVLVMDGWDIFPYGNSFINGLLTAPTTRIIEILDLEYVSVGSWFSQEYLGISNGAGFSIIAEVLINHGPYLLPPLMAIFGVLIYVITDIENKSLETDITKIIFSIIMTLITVNISRNVFRYIAGEILFTTVQYFLYYGIFMMLFNKRKSGSKSMAVYSTES